MHLLAPLTPTLTLTLTLTLLTLLPAHARPPCESFCKYRFCANLLRDGPVLQPDNRVLLLGLPNSALGPVPCLIRASGRLRFLSNVTGGEASASPEFSSKPFLRISKFAAPLVDTPFPGNFFRWVDNESNGRQSLSRGAPAGGQEKALDGACVRMPVRSFEIRKWDGSLRKRVSKKGRRACVGFRTQVPRLLVDFEWSTANDFDLRLTEPNGFEINRFGTSDVSPNRGKLVYDVGGILCQAEFGREQIRYLRRDGVVEKGRYTVRVDHQRACSVSSRYKLRVYYDGGLLLDESGTISEVGESVVVRTFDIPE